MERFLWNVTFAYFLRAERKHSFKFGYNLAKLCSEDFNSGLSPQEAVDRKNTDWFV